MPSPVLHSYLNPANPLRSSSSPSSFVAARSPSYELLALHTVGSVAISLVCVVLSELRDNAMYLFMPSSVSCTQWAFYKH